MDESDLICPLCLDVMTNPVTLALSGFHYDLGCLKRLVRSDIIQGPTTRKEIVSNSLVFPEPALWDRCHQYLVSLSPAHSTNREERRPLFIPQNR